MGMSNEALISQNMDVDSVHNVTSSNSTAEASDPASSLRAAALLTLKLNKKRKPAGDQSLTPNISTRPIIVDNSIQLDYGQEDVSSSTPEVPAPQPPQANLPQVDMEDGQIREEGEISDSEDISVEGAAKSTSQPRSGPPPRHSSQPAPSLDVHSGHLRRTPSPRSAVSLKVESPSHNTHERMTDLPATISGSNGHSKTSEGLITDYSPFFVDPDHVRPGMEMNQGQYDTAKDIILDLLGWGVPPAYLLDCGLSREIVFYVFSELNLRLPDGFDVTGLVPYLPSTAGALIRRALSLEASSSQLNSQRLDGHSILSKSLASGQDHRVSGAVQRPAVVNTPSPPALTTPTTSGASTDSSGNAALHDMERQRRQELLARKAVQASRKGRGAGSTSPSTLPAASDDQDVEMASLVPSETVDDFLKSIGPVSDDENCGNQMDVDEIPGLGGPSSRTSVVSTPAVPMHQDSIAVSDSAVVSPPQRGSLSVQGNAPNSVDSILSPLDQASRRSSSSEETMNQNGFSRRNGKRPVAADFVDFDVGPRGRDHQSTQNSHSQSHQLKRKLGGSFASISTMRRCVIDLSDSEDEIESGSVREAGARHIQLSPKSARVSAPVSAGPSGYSTPPYPSLAGAPASSHRTMSPAALAEKEMEIQKMRQMIAEREKGRIKKFKKPTTKPSTDSNALDVPIIIKQEEEETSVSLTPTNELITPAPTLSNDANREPTFDTIAANTVPKNAGVSASTTPSIGDVVSSGNTLNSGTLTAHDQAPIVSDKEKVVNGYITEQAQESSTEGVVDVDTASSSSTQMIPEMSQLHLKLDGNLDRLQEKHSLQSTYTSLFDSYPQLRSSPQPIIPEGRIPTNQSAVPSNLSSLSNSSLTISSQSIPSPSAASLSSFPYSHSSSSSTHSQLIVFPLPNLRPLKLVTISQLLNPSKRVCQYEIPGWGVCRDNGCEDIHLNRPATGDAMGAPLPMTQPNDQDVAMFLSAALPDSWISAYGSSFTPRMTALLEDIRHKNPTMDLEERAARALAVLEVHPPAT